MKPSILSALAIAISGPALASETSVYKYDARGRLTQVDIRHSGGTGTRGIYTYDAAANRTRVLSSGPFKPVQIYAGTQLNSGEGILSSDTRFLLILETNGNLNLYGPNVTLLWSSNTQGQGAVTAAMQGDGNFVLYRADNFPVWYSGTNGSGGTRIAVQDDGNVVLYTASGVPVWYTGTCCQ